MCNRPTKQLLRPCWLVGWVHERLGSAARLCPKAWKSVCIYMPQLSSKKGVFLIDHEDWIGSTINGGITEARGKKVI